MAMAIAKWSIPMYLNLEVATSHMSYAIIWVPIYVAIAAYIFTVIGLVHISMQVENLHACVSK